jgi:3'-5' exoribonuclease
MDKGKYVNELSPGDKFWGVYLIGEKKSGTAKNGSTFVRLTLSDRTGELNSFIWDKPLEKTAGFEKGDAVGVAGLAEVIDKGRLRVKIDKIKKLQDSEVDLSQLVQASARDSESLFAEIEQILSTLDDPHIRTLVGNILARDGFKDAFVKTPAAKGVHHNFIGGLLEHTLSVMNACNALYPAFSGYGLNRDIILTGAFLHDIGKVREYSSGKVIEVTTEGRLVGHIYFSAKITDEEASNIEGFPEELKLQLIHLILSHHGALEFGSPKVPMTKEAIFLHMIDDLDAKLAGFSSIIESTPESESFSNYSNIYERYIYTRSYEPPAQIESGSKADPDSD